MSAHTVGERRRGSWASDGADGRGTSALGIGTVHCRRPPPLRQQESGARVQAAHPGLCDPHCWCPRGPAGPGCRNRRRPSHRPPDPPSAIILLKQPPDERRVRYPGAATEPATARDRRVRERTLRHASSSTEVGWLTVRPCMNTANRLGPAGGCQCPADAMSALSAGSWHCRASVQSVLTLRQCAPGNRRCPPSPSASFSR